MTIVDNQGILTRLSPQVRAAPLLLVGVTSFAASFAFRYALAEAMKEEYDAISQAGFLLQLDCPDLALGRLRSSGENADYRGLHIKALNHAVRAIPPDRLRLHLCWGNYEGPHHRDIPLQKIIHEVLQARPLGLSFEGSNPRHEHEWKVFEEVKLPEGKVVIPVLGRLMSNGGEKVN